ncbi:hypothetical protein Daus18300_002324 [Diaporthe australafricana]|uniref:Ankyrin repeat protein n=1 Tax=Diaporthe australafricana TaxID=127596 RepID=A0ABR3XQG2_9PEZI
MAEALGAASAVVQLIGALSSGLRTLQKTVVAIKDAPRDTRRMEGQIKYWEQCLKLLEQYFQQRPTDIPFEAQVYETIQEIANSCLSPLRTLRERLPKSTSNVAMAFDLWFNDSSITQARNHIDEYIRYLNILIQTLNSFKADKTEQLLREVATFLKETASQRQPNQYAAMYIFDRPALDTTLKVRAAAKSAATYVVESADATNIRSPRATGPLRLEDASPVDGTTPLTNRRESRRALEHEWDQNRKDLKRYIDYQLFEGAEKLQQRAMWIKAKLNDHGVPFEQEERDEMDEQLADILIQCDIEGSTEQAFSLLEKRIAREDSNDAGTEVPNLITASPSSSPARQRRLNLHSKLGRLYRETWQMDHAAENLRIAFDAYAEEDPRDLSKIDEIGQELLCLYEDRVAYGGTEHWPVSKSQLQAFVKELEGLLGRPLEQRRKYCDRALEWCREWRVDVPTENGEPRFDIMDGEGSSPLHCAAENCKDKIALQQIIRNSEILENPDGSGDTPLLVAVESSNIKALQLLLQNGASIKSRDNQDQTPLHRSQKSPVTKYLLQNRLRRASTTTSGVDGGRRFSSSSSSTLNTSPPNSIPDQDLDIDAQDAHKKTALYLACEQGKGSIVELLLQAGADPNRSAYGRTPLAATIESKADFYSTKEGSKKRVEIVTALVRRGADPGPGKRVLSDPKGTQKEILKALGTRRDSGYQASVSSTTTSLQLDLGDEWSFKFP